MKTDQILQKMKTAENLRFQDVELAEVSRAAGNEARASEAEFQIGVLGLAPVAPGPIWAKA
jgi:hypothetical protein